MARNHFDLFGNLRREALIEAPSREKRKPLAKIVENLILVLAQHLTAVKDVIFVWPITSPKIFNPSNHMTRRAVKNILQSQTMINSWWHESEDPNGLDQRLSFLGSQRFVPIKKNKCSGSRRKICQVRIKESLWDQGNSVVTFVCGYKEVKMQSYSYHLLGTAAVLELWWWNMIQIQSRYIRCLYVVT